MKDTLGTAAVGLLFGFCLHRIGFGSWDEVHKMFTFASLRLFLGFGCAVALLAIGFALIAKLQRPKWTPRPIHKGTIPGGILFGVGWALCGACPSIALVQLGDGQWLSLLSLAGIVLGNALYAPIHARWFRFDSGTCAND